MGNDLANGEYEVKRRIQKELVDLGRYAVVQLAFRYFLDIGGRHLAHGHDIVAPVVYAEKVERHVAEHLPQLMLGHCGMGAESRHHVCKRRPVIVIDHFGNGSGVGVESGKVRRNCKDTLADTKRIKYFLEGGPYLFRADAVRFRTSCVV